MPDQPTASERYVPETDEVAQAILAALLDRYPALVSLEELEQHFAFPPEHAFSAMAIDEGVNDLARFGLAHRLDRFAFASHAAKRAAELHP